MENNDTRPNSENPQTPEEVLNEWLNYTKKEINRIKELREKDSGIDVERGIRGFIAMQIFQDSVSPLFGARGFIEKGDLSSIENQRRVQRGYEQAWLCLKSGLSEFGYLLPRHRVKLLKQLIRKNDKFVNEVITGKEIPRKKLFDRTVRIYNAIHELPKGLPALKHDMEYYSESFILSKS